MEECVEKMCRITMGNGIRYRTRSSPMTDMMPGVILVMLGTLLTGWLGEVPRRLSPLAVRECVVVAF